MRKNKSPPERGRPHRSYMSLVPQLRPTSPRAYPGASHPDSSVLAVYESNECGFHRHGHADRATRWWSPTALDRIHALWPVPPGHRTRRFRAGVCGCGLINNRRSCLRDGSAYAI